MDKLPKIYIFGWIAAIALALGPLLIDETARKQYAVFLIPAILSIITPIVIDQWNAFRDREKLKSDIVAEIAQLRDALTRECQRAITNAQVVTRFKLTDAHNYVRQNALRAKRVYNTRLTDHSSEIKNTQYMDARDSQDRGFKEAILRGTEYHLVYDLTQETGVIRFRDQIEKEIQKRKSEDKLAQDHFFIMHANGVDSRSMPLIQFIVLEYENENDQECLIGYGLGDEIATQDIYLIRNPALCRYLKEVHGHYVHASALKPQQAPNPGA